MSVDPICISVSVRGQFSTPREFDGDVSIGRHLSCDIVIEEEGVSRQHVKLYQNDRGWLAADNNSANGLYHQGRKVELIQIEEKLTLSLGLDGPELLLQPLDRNVTQVLADEFTHSTERIHSLIQKQKRKHALRTGILALFSGIIISALLFVILQQKQTIGESQSIAVGMFYDIKTLEVQLVKIDSQVRKSGSLSALANTKKRKQQLTDMRRRYQSYLQEIGEIKKADMTKEDIILKVAGDFGESEIELPEDFSREVLTYIDKWKSSNRLQNVLQRIEANKQKQIVLDALRDYGLPDQFFYLPLQESNYQIRAIGPETYAGIAKGAWQFIPSTATEYGLNIGPLAAVSEYDAEDERFDFERATAAAVNYLYDIYSTEAQASGLLVMASYNWGHNKVRALVAQMPDNPRERNFWKLIKNHKLPAETYDYVLMIFSAAVIGEDPQLFGFDFENPLA